MNPGDLCQLLPEDGAVVIRHVAPCPDGFATGAVTLPGSPTVIRRDFPPGTPCTCPGDCACRAPAWMHRHVACGCRQH